MSAKKYFTSMPIDDACFDTITRMVFELCGIKIDSGKQAFVAARLGPVVKREGLSSFNAYYEAVKADQSGRLRSELVDRITTNHTFFNRESQHFAMFTERALPEAVRRNKIARRLRIWCAASSTGEEPYTLAMLMMNHLGHDYDAWDAGVLATDISTRVLEVAREGIYPAEAVKALPDTVRTKYFEARPDGRLQVSERVRRELTFRRFNLMNSRLPFRDPFDAIFCRNVMIYFDAPTRAALVERFHGAIVPGGYLFVGAAESIASGSRFTQIAPSVYQRGA